MVNPIKNRPVVISEPVRKKKLPKEVDLCVKKAVKKTNSSIPEKTRNLLNATQKIAAKQAYMAAEKASAAARVRAFQTQQAALKAQKALFLAQRAHMAQQAAAAKRARAAEKAKKAAQKAAKRASELRKVAKIKAYLARPEEKKRSGLLKKYIPSFGKKKKNL